MSIISVKSLIGRIKVNYDAIELHSQTTKQNPKWGMDCTTIMS